MVPQCERDDIKEKKDWWISKHKSQQHSQHGNAQSDSGNATATSKSSSNGGSNTQGSSTGWTQGQGQQDQQQQQSQQHMQRNDYRPRRGVTSFGVQVFQQPHNGSVYQPACRLSQSELQVQLKDQLLLDSASTIEATIMCWK